MDAISIFLITLFFLLILLSIWKLREYSLVFYDFEIFNVKNIILVSSLILLYLFFYFIMLFLIDYDLPITVFYSYFFAISIFLFIKNYRDSNFWIGLVSTLFQLILSFIGLIAIFAFFGFLERRFLHRPVD